jgi:predicted ABC-type ATPase
LARPAVSTRKGDRPTLWIIAGPNGSGKSSLYERADIEDFGGSVWIINPDLLTSRIIEAEGLPLKDANLQAVIRIEDWLQASIRAQQTVGVETVLSTDKYRRLVTLAKQSKFDVRLIYVLLDSVERNIERVRIRVAKGGHAVDPEKIRARRTRSLAQLPWFLHHADKAWIFDNSQSEPSLIAEKTAGTLVVYENALPEIVQSAIEVTRLAKGKASPTATSDS